MENKTRQFQPNPFKVIKCHTDLTEDENEIEPATKAQKIEDSESESSSFDE